MTDEWKEIIKVLRETPPQREHVIYCTQEFEEEYNRVMHEYLEK